MPAARRRDVFERYLSLWVALCIAGGIVIGKAAPGLMAGPSRRELGHANLPIAVLAASGFAGAVLSGYAFAFLPHS